MNPAMPGLAGPLLLAALALIATLVPPTRPTACDPDWAADESGQAESASIHLMLAVGVAL